MNPKMSTIIKGSCLNCSDELLVTFMISTNMNTTEHNELPQLLPEDNVCVFVCFFNSDTPTCFLNDAFWDSKRYMTIIILYILYLYYAISHAMRLKS